VIANGKLAVGLVVGLVMPLVIFSVDSVSYLSCRYYGEVNVRLIPPATNDMPKTHKTVALKAMMCLQNLPRSGALSCEYYISPMST
jgi:hypothetical protein